VVVVNHATGILPKMRCSRQKHTFSHILGTWEWHILELMNKVTKYSKFPEENNY
jgi:hypothetical protein